MTRTDTVHQSISDSIIPYVERTRTYLQSELAVLESVPSYDIIYLFVDQLSGRIKKFVESQTPMDTDLRKLYLLEVSGELKRRASSYGPMDGSVYEDIGRRLNALADEFLLRA